MTSLTVNKFNNKFSKKLENPNINSNPPYIHDTPLIDDCS